MKHNIVGRKVAAVRFNPDLGREEIILDNGHIIGFIFHACDLYDARVYAELGRAMVKFPLWPTDPFHAKAILDEESGELMKAMVEHVYEPEKTTVQHVYREAFQTAAMALRFVRSLEQYKFAPSAQHEQALL